jgi:hypothetical protein
MDKEEMDNFKVRIAVFMEYGQGSRIMQEILLVFLECRRLDSVGRGSLRLCIPCDDLSNASYYRNDDDNDDDDDDLIVNK